MMEKEKQLEFYRKMLRIRRFEETAQDAVYKGEIPGAVHLSIGQEAVAAGACGALEETDFITSTHRGHGHTIAKGARTDRCMAELYGKETGYCKGKGGSLHIAAPELGAMGANGIVGGGIPIATGIAFAAQKLKTGAVVICFFGDGAANQGTFHESVNLAAAFSLPVIYLCENNLYGVSCRQETVRKVEKIAERAAGYGIPGVTIDGNDVEKVYGTVLQAVEKARSGQGPSLVECMTYRWRGHFEGEPEFSVYRSQEELEEWKEKCPIKAYRDKLLAEGVESAEVEKVEREVEQEIADALAFAKGSEFPQIAEALTDIYA